MSDQMKKCVGYKKEPCVHPEVNSEGELPLTEFHVDKRRKDGRRSTCKSCSAKGSGQRNNADPFAQTIRNLGSRPCGHDPEELESIRAALEEAVGKPCPVLGTLMTAPVYCDKRLGPKGSGCPTVASVDRIDNTKGYVKGNWRVMSWRANNLLGDITSEEEAALVAFLTKHQGETLWPRATLLKEPRRPGRRARYRTNPTSFGLPSSGAGNSSRQRRRGKRH